MFSGPLSLSVATSTQTCCCCHNAPAAAAAAATAVVRRLKLDGPYDSKVLPIMLAITLVASLLVVFSGAIVRLHSDT
jgi:hypothetical protein